MVQLFPGCALLAYLFHFVSSFHWPCEGSIIILFYTFWKLPSQSIKHSQGAGTKVNCYLDNGYASRLNKTSKWWMSCLLYYLGILSTFMLINMAHCQGATPYLSQLPVPWVGLCLQDQQSETFPRLNIWWTTPSSTRDMLITVISFPRGKVAFERPSCWNVYRGTGSFPDVVLGSEKALTTFPESKYNKHFKEVLTGVHPAEKGSRDMAGGSGLELIGCWGPRGTTLAVWKCSELSASGLLQSSG